MVWCCLGGGWVDCFVAGALVIRLMLSLVRFVDFAVLLSISPASCYSCISIVSDANDTCQSSFPDNEASSFLIPGLPEDISTSCIARVPCHYFKQLKFVSKAWMRAFSSGTIFTERKSSNLTECFLVATIIDKDVTTEITRVSVNLFDPKKRVWDSLPPFFPSKTPVKIKLLNCIAMGQNLFVSIVQKNAHSFSVSEWILNGATRVWRLNKKTDSNRRFNVFSNSVGGKTFIGFAEGIDTGQDYDQWAMSMGELDSVRQQIQPECFPGIICSSFVRGSVVHNANIHFRVWEFLSDQTWMTFDPELHEWLKNSELSSHEPGMAGEFPLAVVRNTLYGVWWNYHGYQKMGAKVMRFDEDFKKWVFVTGVPAHRNPNWSVKEYRVQSLGDRLYLFEVGIVKGEDSLLAVSLLHVLSIPEMEAMDSNFVWEVVESPVHGGDIQSQEVFFSVLEI